MSFKEYSRLFVVCLGVLVCVTPAQVLAQETVTENPEHSGMPVYSPGTLGGDGAAGEMPVFSVLKFSGRLRNADGTALTGTVGVTFAFYSEQSGSAPLWVETQNVVLDSEGRYTVLLGSQSQGLPLEIFAADQARWLGVQALGQSEQPRVLLVSVPYALKAAEAERLAGREAEEFVLNEGLEAQVRTEIRSQLESEIATRALTSGGDSGPAALVDGSGTVGAIPRFTATNIIGNSIISDDGAGVVTVNGRTELRAGVAQTRPSLFITGQFNEDGIAPVEGMVRINNASGDGFGLKVDTGGTAIWGASTIATGFKAALFGSSAADNGRGILGRATATTGGARGIEAESEADSGFGILARAKHASGTSTGIQVEVTSPAGTGLVVNAKGGGKVFSGQNNGVETFALDAAGNVGSNGTVTATAFVGDGSGLTNVTAPNFSGLLSGDVVGPQGATLLAAIQGFPLAPVPPVPGDHLRFDGLQWSPSRVDLGADVIGVLAVSNGGTGATNAADARTNLGAASLAANNFTQTQTISGGSDLLFPGPIWADPTHDKFIGFGDAGCAGGVPFSSMGNLCTGLGEINGDDVLHIATGVGPIILTGTSVEIPVNPFFGTTALNVAGPVTATAFVGNGAGLTGIPSSAFGTVTDVTAGTGLIGAPNPITASGTISLDTAFTDTLYTTLGAFGAHTGDPAAHHVKTTNASELTSGTLADARLSGNIPRLNLPNVFSPAGQRISADPWILGPVYPISVPVAGALNVDDTTPAPLWSSAIVAFQPNGSGSADKWAIFAETSSPLGEVATFRGVGGRLISGWTGGPGGFNRVFLVDGAGIVTATGFVGDGSGLTFPILNAGVGQFTDINATGTITAGGDIISGGTVAGNSGQFNDVTVSGPLFANDVIAPGIGDFGSLNVNGFATVAQNLNVSGGAVVTLDLSVGGPLFGTDIIANNFIGGVFSGDGGGLFNLQAGALVGTISDANLSANVALRNAANNFTVNQTISGGSDLLFPGPIWSDPTHDKFIGFGDAGCAGAVPFSSMGNLCTGLGEINGDDVLHIATGVGPIILTGTSVEIPVNPFFGTTALNVAGPVTATAFAGDGSALTGIPTAADISGAIATHTAIPGAHHTKTTDASELTSGILADARLSPNIPRLNTHNIFAPFPQWVDADPALAPPPPFSAFGPVAGSVSARNASVFPFTTAVLAVQDSAGELVPDQYALWAEARSPIATVATFRGVGGDIITGWGLDPAGLPSEVFRVNGTGFVTATGFAGDGSGLTFSILNAGVGQFTDINATGNITAGGVVNGLSGLFNDVTVGGPLFANDVIAFGIGDFGILNVNGPATMFADLTVVGPLVGSVIFGNSFNGGFFNGDGGGLFNLQASALVGTISDANLSANVALRNAANNFTVNQTISGGSDLLFPGPLWADPTHDKFIGFGDQGCGPGGGFPFDQMSGFCVGVGEIGGDDQLQVASWSTINLTAQQVTISPNPVLGGGALNVNGPVTAVSFAGDGSALTGIATAADISGAIATHTAIPGAHHTKTTDASELTSGILNDARLSGNIPRLNAPNAFFPLSQRVSADPVLVGPVYPTSIPVAGSLNVDDSLFVLPAPIPLPSSAIVALQANPLGAPDKFAIYAETLGDTGEVATFRGGGGNLISGWTGGLPVFTVDGGGTVTANAFIGDGSGLTFPTLNAGLGQFTDINALGNLAVAGSGTFGGPLQAPEILAANSVVGTFGQFDDILANNGVSGTFGQFNDVLAFGSVQTSILFADIGQFNLDIAVSGDGSFGGTVSVNGPIFSTSDIVAGGDMSASNATFPGTVSAGDISSSLGRIDLLTTDSLLVTPPNEAVTGTTLNRVAKLTGDPVTAVTASTGDTGGAIGVVVGGAGTAGNAEIAVAGTALCEFDGPATAGNYVKLSSTVAGACSDAGPGYPGSGQVLGRVLASVPAGITQIGVFGPEIRGALTNTPNFSVDAAGNLSAASGVFTGNVNVSNDLTVGGNGTFGGDVNAGGFVTGISGQFNDVNVLGPVFANDLLLSPFGFADMGTVFVNQDLNVSGAIFANDILGNNFFAGPAGTFTGNGGGLSNLQASALVGPINPANLPGNVALRDAPNTFTAAQTLAATGVATPVTGFSSNNVFFTASVFDSIALGAVNRTLSLNAVPFHNNTADPSAGVQLTGNAPSSGPLSAPLLTVLNNNDSPTMIALQQPFKTWWIGQNQSPDGGNVDDFFIYDVNAGTTRFLIHSSTGNVGIGIGAASPASKLQVGGTVTATAFVGDGSGLTNLPVSGGTVTLVDTGTGLLGGPITTVGTVSLDTAFTDGRYAQLAAPNLFTAAQVIDAPALVSPALNVVAHGGHGIFAMVDPGFITFGSSQIAGPLNFFVTDNGDVVATSFTPTSSRRYKTNIRPLEGALGLVTQLQGVRYERKTTGKEEIGVIAEEVAKVVPELVAYERDNPEQAKGVDYDKFAALLIEAVKAQQSQLTEQQAQIEKQNQLIAKLLAELAVVKARLDSQDQTKAATQQATAKEKNTSTTVEARKTGGSE